MPLNKSRRPLKTHEQTRCLRSIFHSGVVCACLAVAVGDRRHLVGGEVAVRRRQGTAAG
jgi:hypothetical protein